MDEVDRVVIQKKQAAIKLAKNLEPFNPDLGHEFDAVYIETLTEDIKQLAREMKKLARVVAVNDSNHEFHLSVKIDDEEERLTKVMRRYCTRIQKMADLIYETAYIDFEGLQQDALKEMMMDEGDEDDDDE